MSGGIEIDLIFGVGIEVDLTSVLGSKETGFCVGDRNLLGFSVGIEIDLVFERGSNLTLFLCEGGEGLVFRVIID